MWSINQTDEFRHQALQIEPNHDRFAERFAGVLISLARDPYAVGFPLWEEDPSRRVVTDRSFMAGFEIFVGVIVDDEHQTVVLQWIRRVFVEEPDDEGR